MSHYQYGQPADDLSDLWHDIESLCTAENNPEGLNDCRELSPFTESTDYSPISDAAQESGLFSLWQSLESLLAGEIQPVITSDCSDIILGDESIGHNDIHQERLQTVLPESLDNWLSSQMHPEEQMQCADIPTTTTDMECSSGSDIHHDIFSSNHWQDVETWLADEIPAAETRDSTCEATNYNVNNVVGQESLPCALRQDATNFLVAEHKSGNPRDCRYIPTSCVSSSFSCESDVQKECIPNAVIQHQTNDCTGMSGRMCLNCCDQNYHNLYSPLRNLVLNIQNKLYSAAVKLENETIAKDCHQQNCEVPHCNCTNPKIAAPVSTETTLSDENEYPTRPRLPVQNSRISVEKPKYFENFIENRNAYINEKLRETNVIWQRGTIPHRSPCLLGIPTKVLPSSRYQKPLCTKCNKQHSGGYGNIKHEKLNCSEDNRQQNCDVPYNNSICHPAITDVYTKPVNSSGKIELHKRPRLQAQENCLSQERHNIFEDFQQKQVAKSKESGCSRIITRLADETVSHFLRDHFACTLNTVSPSKDKLLLGKELNKNYSRSFVAFKQQTSTQTDNVSQVNCDNLHCSSLSHPSITDADYLGYTAKIKISDSKESNQYTHKQIKNSFVIEERSCNFVKYIKNKYFGGNQDCNKAITVSEISKSAVSPTNYSVNHESLPLSSNEQFSFCEECCKNHSRNSDAVKHVMHTHTRGIRQQVCNVSNYQSKTCHVQLKEYLGGTEGISFSDKTADNKFNTLQNENICDSKDNQNEYRKQSGIFVTKMVTNGTNTDMECNPTSCNSKNNTVTPENIIITSNDLPKFYDEHNFQHLSDTIQEVQSKNSSSEESHDIVPSIETAPKPSALLAELLASDTSHVLNMKRGSQQTQASEPLVEQGRKCRRPKEDTSARLECRHPGCGLFFITSRNLKVHLRSHTGEKPFSCDWKNCGMTFFRSDQLSRHCRKHTGDRPYHCDICSKLFSRSDHLKEHKEKHSLD